MNLEHYNWAEAQWPGYTIEDRLGWSRNGLTDIFTQPEDWHFSRWLDSMNWPYYATMSLAVDHFGFHCFSNRGAWGMLRDLTPIQPSKTEFENAIVDPRQLDARRTVRVPVLSEGPARTFGVFEESVQTNDSGQVAVSSADVPA